MHGVAICRWWTWKFRLYDFKHMAAHGRKIVKASAKDFDGWGSERLNAKVDPIFRGMGNRITAKVNILATWQYELMTFGRSTIEHTIN